jgi:hypothetical protein
VRTDRGALLLAVQSLVIIGISTVVCVLTTLSLSAICTNGEVKGGKSSRLPRPERRRRAVHARHGNFLRPVDPDARRGVNILLPFL